MLAVCSKNDLIYKDYKWTAYPEQDPKMSGEPNSTLFNRSEGAEVLYMIGVLCNRYPFIASRWFYQKIEELIHNQLPSNIETQVEVFIWLIRKVVSHF